MVDKLTVFISYTWEDKNHNEWVSNLASTIESLGLRVIMDKTNTKIGHNLYFFMESSIRDADIVLMIFTPDYKRKANNREGGVGFEFNIITPQLQSNLKTNEKFIGILRKGNMSTSIPDNLKTNIYSDLRKENPKYANALNTLTNQISNSKHKILPKLMEKKEPEYQPINELIKTIEKSTKIYFEKVFELSKADNAIQKALLKPKVIIGFNNWENEIIKYTDEIKPYYEDAKFVNYEREAENFRTKVFKKTLWTVGAALKTPDPDLARYKRDFADADPEELVVIVKRILDASKNYINKKANKFNYDNIKTTEELHLDYLDNEEMFMIKIIGFGIRSEILHRNFPANFPIMTQKSLWAMYFMSQSAQEFITVEKRKGHERISHNWSYDYARFSFIMLQLSKQLAKIFKEYQCIMKPELRFGYVNVFLSKVHKYHKGDIEAMHEWVE